MQKGDILCFGSGTEGRLPFRRRDLKRLLAKASESKRVKPGPSQTFL